MEIDADETLEAAAALHEVHRLAQVSETDTDFVGNIVKAASDPKNPLHVLFRWRPGCTMKYRRRRVRDFLRALAAARLEHKSETAEA